MAKPTLYKEGEKNELQSAHTLARHWNVSIKTARKRIKKLLKDGNLKVFRKNG